MIRLKNNKWSFYQGPVNTLTGDAFIYEDGDEFIRLDWKLGQRKFNTILEAMRFNREIDALEEVLNHEAW
jgi:hypothetical protein